jgi:hypothetical protein
MGLLALLVAAAPARALPRQVAGLLYGRRESLAFTGVAVLLAFLIALLIAHLGS